MKINKQELKQNKLEKIILCLNYINLGRFESNVDELDESKEYIIIQKPSSYHNGDVMFIVEKDFVQDRSRVHWSGGIVNVVCNEELVPILYFKDGTAYGLLTERVFGTDETRVLSMFEDSNRHMYDEDCTYKYLKQLMLLEREGRVDIHHMLEKKAIFIRHKGMNVLVNCDEIIYSDNEDNTCEVYINY